VPAAEVTGAEELLLGLVLGVVAAEVTAPAAEATVPAAEVTGAEELLLGLVLGLVAAEATVPAAEVTGPEPTGGVVAACACRENTSKTARIPAATIATCTDRKAMCRKIGCGMSSSRTNGTDRTRLVVPIISDPKHAGALYFRPISLWSPATGHLRSVHKCTYCSVTTVQYGLRPEQGGWRIATELIAVTAAAEAINPR
jgi:hypothetical protein